MQQPRYKPGKSKFVPGGKTMAFVIAEPCIGVKDKACVEICPMDCIHGDADSQQLYINPGECIDCGACEPECPAEAIFQDSALPAEWKHYQQINAAYYEDK
jgi:NAD-dependent dihydropyrimidine dehydrogenase PreA subunit